MSKKLKWLAIGGAMILAIVLFTLLGLSEQAARGKALESARASIRQAGIALDADQFRQILMATSPAEDAWPIYAGAIRTYFPRAVDENAQEEGDPGIRDTLMSVSEGIRYWRRGNRNWDFTFSRSDADLRLRELLDTVSQAAKLGGIVPVREWETGHLVALPEVNELAKLGRLLVYDGIRAVESGDNGRLRQRILDLVAMATQVWRVPLTAYQMLGVSIAHDAMALVRTVVCVFDIHAMVATDLFKVLEPILTMPDLKASFGGLVYNGMATLNLLNSPERMRQAELEARVIRRNPPRPELRQQIELDFLQAANRILARWPADPEDIEGIRKALDKDDAKMNLSLGLFSRFMRQTVGNDPEEGLFERSLEPFESHLARVRLFKVLVAAYAARAKDERFPAEIPLQGQDAIDPFSGKPLRYITDFDGTGFRAYSFGPDREDNEGSRPRTEGGSLDIVMLCPDRRIGW